MAQIGSILRGARIHMGLSLKEVSETTKVRVKYLVALEEDDYGAIPGPTFIKAYLRTYATTLRLDADALVEEYRSTYERRKSSTGEYSDLTLEQMRTRTMRARKKRPARNTRRGYTIVGVLAVVAVVLLAYFGSSRGSSEPVLDVNSVGVTTTTVAGAGSSTTLSGIVTTTSTEAVYTGGDVLLRIVATGDCSLVIRNIDRSGDILFQGVLRSGDEKTVQGAKRYWVNMGNPGAVQIYINELLKQSPADAGMYYITETKIESAE
jgi:cytoskeleton protein RodZ